MNVQVSDKSHWRSLAQPQRAPGTLLELRDRPLTPLAASLDYYNTDPNATTSLHKSIQLHWALALMVLAITWSLLAVACGNGPQVVPTQAPTKAAAASVPTPTASTPAPVTKAPTSGLASPAPTPVQALPTPLANTSTPVSDTPTPVPDRPTPVPTQRLDPLILQIAEGTSARYLVKEQFARRNLPNDAVGETSAVSGSIRFRLDGTIDPAGSRFEVQLRRLSSDDDERDEFLLEESLESLKFSVAEFVLEEAPGLPWPLPQDGQTEFQLQGEMTVHGVTSPAIWEVTAQFTPQGATGQARTSFNFAKFGIERPSAFFLLSVEDLIRLELDFVLTYRSIESVNPPG
ncbi:MAG: YceI family protein [Chloroflexi bacterium]|nr:YceI family protein [Chloroflexota bacterium]